MSLRIRRGLSTDIPTPVEGELLYTTDNGNLYVGFYDPEQDAVIPKLTSASLVDDSNPTLSSNLDLNGNNIVGTGDINIDGTITATGNINLGDGVEDDVVVGGQIGSDLIPNINRSYDLGTQNVTWRNGYFEGLDVDGEISAGSLLVTNISGPDSTSIYNGAEGELDVPVVTADSINAVSITGDIKGSIFSDDSSILVDAVSNSFFTASLEISGSTLRRTDAGAEVRLDSKSFAIQYYEVDSDLDNAPRLLLRAGRSDNGVLSPVQTNDTVGAIIGTIFDGTQERVNSAISIVIDEKTGSYDYPSKFKLSLVGPEGTEVNPFSVNSSGTASANIFKTGSYNNESDRDASIPNPEAGMIIFLSGHDDSAGTPKFQGYDGNSWVDIN